MPSKENFSQVNSPNQAPVLPEPSATELEHSHNLKQEIIQQIQQHDGKIPFEHFMQLALYAPGFGYYSAGTRKFGAEGDFITAPEISPIFSQVLAIQSQQMLEQVKQKNNDTADILEFGAGSGKMALEIIIFLSQRDSLPNNYYILDLSADLIDRQKTFLQNELKQRGKKDLFERFTWINQLPSDFNGVILANEVLDAMPARLIKIDKQQLYERFVGFDEDQNEFIWIDQKTDDKHLVQSQKIIQSLFTHGLTAEAYENSCYIS
ncbi:MAG: SAM-dependent methyltransferase, partial [Gammaproteobacteria bacterium]|nr:SAM-dependent methyltransferase [Gammaproteobacteria bacterium]